MNQEKVIESLKERFREEPFARKFGIRIVDLEPGRAVVEAEITADMENIFGMAHGGAVFALIDAAFELAGNSEGTMSVALNMSIAYTQAVRRGDVIRAEAREVHTTRKTGLYNIEVRNQNGEMVARSQATVYRLGKPLPWLD
jgi:acyl-CoA thioesterase